MNFIQHTETWARGEIFEATLGAACGVVLIVVAIIFWKYGTGIYAKAVIAPVAVVGLLLVLGTTPGLYTYSNNLEKYKVAYQQDAAQFISDEKARIEKFDRLYTMTKVFATVFLIAAILIFWFSGSATLKGVGIGLILVAMAGLVFDYFSEGRAEAYYQQIMSAQESFEPRER
ncbi:MAG: hypothetical protein OXD00_10825 [Gammaproteobacteria bacterium]|nr:hypothetical protein [Gammaproteobacteria bacterium]